MIVFIINFNFYSFPFPVFLFASRSLVLGDDDDRLFTYNVLIIAGGQPRGAVLIKQVCFGGQDLLATRERL